MKEGEDELVFREAREGTDAGTLATARLGYDTCSGTIGCTVLVDKESRRRRAVNQGREKSQPPAIGAKGRWSCR